ncbi:MAG TPA: flagellar biosynthetic protein FliQ, partial [Planctomycetaceae bacterium]
MAGPCRWACCSTASSWRGADDRVRNSMDLDTAIDLVRNATFLALTVGAPILIVSMVVGLAISILQAVTQIQEQTL